MFGQGCPFYRSRHNIVLLVIGVSVLLCCPKCQIAAEGYEEAQLDRDDLYHEWHRAHPRGAGASQMPVCSFVTPPAPRQL
jgi:hypothetical protein